MKFLGKSKERAIDGLLRAYVSRSEALRRSCSEFDPDLANAYIEHSLPTSSRSRYEQHLTECGSCRKSVVALARLAGVDGVAAVRNEVRPSLSDRIWQGLSSLSAPQWATAVAAVIVLAISVPLFLSRHEVHPDRDASTAAAESSQPETSMDDHAQAGTVPGAVDKAPAGAVATTQKQSEKREADKGPSSSVAEQSPLAAAVSGDARVDSLKSKATSQTADEVQAKTDRPASDLAGGAGSAGTDVAKNESDKKADQTSEKDSTQSRESRASSGGEQPAKEVARAEMPPPPAPSVRSTPEPPQSRRGMKPGKLGLRDSAGEVTKLPERKIGGKTFQLQDGVWTDRNFDPNKNVPVVNIVRDSNVYKELIDKQTGLKSYLDAFNEHERAIIVYKGKVYKLIPQ